jgi:beta-phosphoglucomutase-like phosphatase (HAD superfamily)
MMGKTQAIMHRKDKQEQKMIDPATLGFDIDGVIADTMHLFLEILKDHYDVHTVKYDDITCYRLDQCLDVDLAVLDSAVTRILNGNYKATLKPLPGAGKVLRRIAETTGRLFMVTARPEPGPIAGWMNDLLDGQHDRATIVATGSYEAKTDILLENGIRWFVEDRLETCHLLKAAGIAPVVFQQPWNQAPHDYLTVGSWPELETRINFP